MTSILSDIRHPVDVESIRRSDWLGLLVGCFFAAPYLLEWLGARVVLVLLALLVAVAVGTLGIRDISVRWRRLPSQVWILVAIGLIHLAATALTDTPYRYQVFRELVFASVLLFVFVTSSFVKNMNGAVIVDGFYTAIITLAVVTASLGLVKCALLDRGIMVDVLLDHFSIKSYPPGTSLKSDYTAAGMLWLTAAFACAALSVVKRNMKYALLIPILIAAGLLSGSRRFLLAVIFVPVFWIAAALLYQNKHRIGKIILTSLLTMSAGYVLSIIVADQKSFAQFQSGDKAWRILHLSDVYRGRLDFAKPPSDTVIKPPFRAYAEVMIGTVNSATSYGTDSRQERWSFAVDEIKAAPFFGVGFSYHKVFSCKFVQCNHIDYPHAPMLSAWLIGGFLGFALVLWFYISVLVLFVTAGRSIFVTGIPAILIALSPFVLVSGDTIFSLLHFLSGVFVLLLSIRFQALDGETAV